MKQDISISGDDKKLLISGSINGGNIGAILIETQAYIDREAGKEINISFRGLKQYNSLCLSFILCCIRHAAKTDKKIYFMDIAQEIDNMLEVYNLKRMIKSHTRKWAPKK